MSFFILNNTCNQCGKLYKYDFRNEFMTYEYCSKVCIVTAEKLQIEEEFKKAEKSPFQDLFKNPVKAFGAIMDNVTSILKGTVSLKKWLKIIGIVPIAFAGANLFIKLAEEKFDVNIDPLNELFAQVSIIFCFHLGLIFFNSLLEFDRQPYKKKLIYILVSYLISILSGIAVERYLVN